MAQARRCVNLVRRVHRPLKRLRMLLRPLNLRKMKAKGKMMVEKKTGEKYASKGAKMKHEKVESKKEQMREYGKVKRK